MYANGKCDRSDEHRHYAYFDGCIACELQANILGYANDNGYYPPWITTEEDKLAECLRDIRALRELVAAPPVPVGNYDLADLI